MATNNSQIANGEGRYYRWQEDKQIVIERTPEQQKIFEEYFVIENVIHKITALLILGVLFLVAGAAMVVFGIIDNKIILEVIGAVCVVIGIVFSVIYMKKITVQPKTVMTDAEYESLVSKRIQEMNVYQKGLNKLGLSAEQVQGIKPIFLTNKIITNTSLTVYNHDDKSMHSSTHYVIVLFFTDDQLLVYKIQFDMCCNMQTEWTSEFFYKDICDVSSHEQRNVLIIGDDKIEYSSVTFDIISSNSQIGFTIDGDYSNNPSVQAMKEKIRAKKLR
ncbi:MAG: hypothetical protein ACI4VK_05895 [Candidatus Coproplasma sp.]